MFLQLYYFKSAKGEIARAEREVAPSQPLPRLFPCIQKTKHYKVSNSGKGTL